MNNKKFINNTSSFMSINGKVIEDKEETTYIYNNNNGQYIKKNFGKIINNKKLNKKEIDAYIERQKPGFYMSNEIFNIATDILSEWSNFTNAPQDLHEIQPGIEKNTQIQPENGKVNNTQIQPVNGKVNNKSIKKQRHKRCFEIETEYPELQNKQNRQNGQNKQIMKKMYKKNALKYHPDKCSRKECKGLFQKLNTNYSDYMNPNYYC